MLFSAAKEPLLRATKATREEDANIAIDSAFQDALTKCQIQATKLDQDLKGRTDKRNTNRKLRRLTKYLHRATPYLSSQGELAVTVVHYLRQCKEKIDVTSGVPKKEALEFEKAIDEFMRLLFQSPTTDKKLLLTIMAGDFIDSVQPKISGNTKTMNPSLEARNANSAGSDPTLQQAQGNIKIRTTAAVHETPAAMPPGMHFERLIINNMETFGKINFKVGQVASTDIYRAGQEPSFEDPLDEMDLATATCPDRKRRADARAKRSRLWHTKFVILAAAIAALFSLHFFNFLDAALSVYMTPFNDCAKSNEWCQQTGSCCMNACNSRIALFWSKIFGREES